MKTYQILLDIDDRFNKTESIKSETEHEKQVYFMHHLNLAVFMVNLVNKKIIDKNLVIDNYIFSLDQDSLGEFTALDDTVSPNGFLQDYQSQWL